ncbi:hypothetical protein N9J83_08875, partial [Opitutales bacterium]|nr:hypothetical protein [Opitutales bacterium]
EWYDNGQICSKYSYKKGLLHGSSISWYDDGTKLSKGSYWEGNKSGLWNNWYENGQQENELEYKNGLIFSAKVWAPDGKRCTHTNLLEGNGKFVTYGIDGKISSEDKYKNGIELFEKRFYWHENGQKRSVGLYKADKKDGLYTTWHENGQKASVQNYLEGKLNGPEEKWHENGTKFKRTIPRPPPMPTQHKMLRGIPLPRRS